MSNCCIQNCNNNISDTAYFKFPTHNPELLRKWIKQIGNPDWKPDENSYICAVHFCAKDVVNHPNRKYLVLKENAVPTIFPEQMNDISSLKTHHSGHSTVNNCATVNPSITMMPSLIQTTPLVLTPTIVEPMSTINSTLLPFSGTPQRFRKILPKLDQNPSVTPCYPPAKNNITSNTPPKSYIIIIPTFDNTKSMSVTSTPPKLSVPNRQKPILRLTVNRKYDNDPSVDKSEMNIHHKQIEVDSESQEDREDTESRLFEEVVIKHETLDKFVVYSLDLVTGEITVSHRDDPHVSGRNAKLLGTHMKLRENPRKRKIWEEPAGLGNMYNRVKKDCLALRSRLQILRKKHKREKDAIEALQKKLTAIEANQGMASAPTAEIILKSPMNIDYDKPHNQINGMKSFFGEPKINDNCLSKVNIQKQPSMNGSQSFVWRSIEQNEDCDFIEIDEATLSIQTCELKTRNSFANTNDSGCVNHSST